MKPLLITLDFINDIVHPQSKIASVADYVEQHHVIEQVNKAVSYARQQAQPIVHVKVGFSSHYQECPPNSPLFGKHIKMGTLKLGEWGTAFHENLDVQAEDIIIAKHRVSALYATPLQAILSARQIDTVIITGVSTNMAVETLARELHDRDYQVIVLEDACAAATEAIHQASLLTLQRITNVQTVSQFVGT